MSGDQVVPVGDRREVRGPRAPYKISGKLSKALRYLCEGKRLAEAARLAGMSDRGLALALKRPSVAARLSDHARAGLAAQLPKAVDTLERVMSSDNMAAAMTGARFVLGAAAGIAMPERPAVAVNIHTDQPVGYVIELSGTPAERPRSDQAGPVIDAEASDVTDLDDRRPEGE